MHKYICQLCHEDYDVSPEMWRCTNCGGLLNLDKILPEINVSTWEQYPHSLWRYYETMPFNHRENKWKSVTMGEGQTPLILLDQHDANVFVKIDYLMPTLSFKDRGAAVLMTKAKEMGVEKVIVDSSGNAGTSVAAYASRCGMVCHVYLNSKTSPKKVEQIKSHGANIIVVEGRREDVALAAQKAVIESGDFYASHVYNPYFYEGTKTYAYEIFEQLQGVPDTLLIPVGNGTLLLGAYLGFQELLKSNLIEKLPKIIGLQAVNCAPLANAFKKNSTEFLSTPNEMTKAEGIAVAEPARAEHILATVRETSGHFISVTEREIESAHSLLAKKGFFVEWTSAVNYAGFLKYDKSDDEIVIFPLCGSGLKSI